MDKIIRRIIEADEEASKKVDEANTALERVQHELNTIKSEIYSKHMEKANIEIEKRRKAELEKAENICSSLKKSYDKKLKALDEAYKKNCSKWVKQIVTNILGEDAGGL